MRLYDRDKRIKKIILIINVVLPILAGSLTYCFIAPDVLFLNNIYSRFVQTQNISLDIYSNVFLKITRFYLMDYLWGYALIFALYYAFGLNKSALKYIYSLAVIFSVVMEFIQLAPIVKGTFDLFDIAVEITAESLAIFIIKKNEQ